MIDFETWWNSSSADEFRRLNDDMDGRVVRPVWDAAIRATLSSQKATSAAPSPEATRPTQAEAPSERDNERRHCDTPRACEYHGCHGKCAALANQRAEAVPQGGQWKLVPVEPTEDRWLRDTLHGAVGGGIEVNDDRLVYQEAEPGEEVRVFWYPVTPVGFYDSKASTLDEAIDRARDAQPAPLNDTKDAARYRHLVETCNVGFDPSEPWQLVIWEPDTGEDWKAKLDAAIDAAMKGNGK